MMKLIVFVEGADDERFLLRYFSDFSCPVEIVKYAEKKKEKTNGYIKSIKRIKDFNYIFITDSDGKDITSKKDYCLDKYPDLEEDKIFVSCVEIESWYLAVASKMWCDNNKVKYIENTDLITKEQFYQLIPRKFNCLSFMLEILNDFQIECAKQRNSSLNHFASCSLV